MVRVQIPYNVLRINYENKTKIAVALPLLSHRNMLLCSSDKLTPCYPPTYEETMIGKDSELHRQTEGEVLVNGSLMLLDYSLVFVSSALVYV